MQSQADHLWSCRLEHKESDTSARDMLSGTTRRRPHISVEYVKQGVSTCRKQCFTTANIPAKSGARIKSSVGKRILYS